MPGACGFFHAGGALRRIARAEVGLRRRRQQHVPFAADDRRARGRAHARGHAGGLRAGRGDCRGSEASGAEKRAARSRSFARRRKRWPARRPSTRTFGPAWARRTKPRAREAAFAAYQVNAALFCAGRAGRRFSALPAGAPRTGSDRRGDRFAALDRLRPGGKSPARPESDPAHATHHQGERVAEESCARLFRRAGYLHHYSVAEGELPAAK